MLLHQAAGSVHGKLIIERAVSLVCRSGLLWHPQELETHKNLMFTMPGLLLFPALIIMGSPKVQQKSTAAFRGGSPCCREGPMQLGQMLRHLCNLQAIVFGDRYFFPSSVLLSSDPHNSPALYYPETGKGQRCLLIR